MIHRDPACSSSLQFKRYVTSIFFKLRTVVRLEAKTAHFAQGLVGGDRLGMLSHQLTQYDSYALLK